MNAAVQTAVGPVLRDRAATPLTPLQLVAIPTRNRPRALARCLASHIEHARRFERRLEILVIDDSTPQSERDNAAVVAALPRQADVRVRHVTSRERRLWVARLSRAVGERCSGLVRTFDADIATGAARNFAMVWAGAQPMLFSDDDIECSPAGDISEAARWSDEPDPTEFTFHEHEQALRPERPRDLLLTYARWLRATTDRRGRRRPVACVMAGVRGAPGMGLPGYLLLKPGITRQRLLSRFETASAGWLERTVPEPVVTERALGLAGHLALDTRLPLPPFMPAGRNQDGVFFALRARLLPEAVGVLLPISVRHGSGRAFDWAGAARRVTTLRINDFVRYLVLTLAKDLAAQADVERRYRILGQALREVATERAFADRVRSFRLAWLRSWEQRAAQALDGVGTAPAAWRDHVRAFHDSIRAAQAVPSTCLPEPFARATWDLGTLLLLWPALTRAGM